MPPERGSGGDRTRGRSDAPSRRGPPSPTPKAKAKPRRPSKSVIAETLAAERETVLQRFDVSRETAERLDAYVELLLKWQAAINLVSPYTLPHVWTRHVGDALALQALAPAPLHWVDLGSGAGLPGLMLAIGNAGRAGAETHLVESNNKKAAFLREAARALALPVAVHATRIEAAGAVIAGAEAVSARALAPLPDLLALVAPHLKPGTVCWFPKGESAASDVAAATAQWRFAMVSHPSPLADGSVILEIADIAPL